MISASNPKIGLALSGGAARGLAHVGVLRALVENGIRIDCVAGTSAGSIVGGAFAAGLSVKEIEDFGRNLRWRQRTCWRRCSTVWSRRIQRRSHRSWCYWWCRSWWRAGFRLAERRGYIRPKR